MEILLGAGEVQRRYLIGEGRHAPEALDAWRPLVARLLDRPGERLYHGLVGMPYWEAGLALPPSLRHPSLADGTWLAMYAAPERTEPYYVGLVARRESDAPMSSLVVAASGGTAHQDAIAAEVAGSIPCLVGAYWGPGMPRGAPEREGAVRAAGECAAILAQLVLEALA